MLMSRSDKCQAVMDARARNPTLGSRLSTARDVILAEFRRSPSVSRRQLARRLGVDRRVVKEFLEGVAVLNAATRLWDFKFLQDERFMARFPEVVRQEELWWESREGAFEALFPDSGLGDDSEEEAGEEEEVAGETEAGEAGAFAVDDGDGAVEEGEGARREAEGEKVGREGDPAMGAEKGDEDGGDETVERGVAARGRRGGAAGEERLASLDAGKKKEGGKRSVARGR